MLRQDIDFDEPWLDPFHWMGSGASFHALRTGRYFFRLGAADDHVDLDIGGTRVSGEWRAEGPYLPETSAILVGGHSYGIAVDVTNTGKVAGIAMKGGAYTASGGCAFSYYQSVDYLPDGWRVLTVR